MNDKHEFIEDMFIVIMKPTMDAFLKQDNPGELIALYSFYYYTAKWQSTNQPKCTTAYAAKGMKWTEARIRKVKKQLCELGLIEDVAEREGGRITGHYIKVKYKLKKSTEEQIRENIDRSPDCAANHTVEKPECGAEQSVANRETNAYSNGNLNAYNSGKENALSNGIETYTRILSHLNEKAGTNYRPTSSATQRHINARLAEGFTIDDFIKVIDVKCAEWAGTDMGKYLRPETLFGNKFENYLNQQTKQKESSYEESRDKAMAENQEIWKNLPGMKII